MTLTEAERAIEKSTEKQFVKNVIFAVKISKNY